MKLQGRNLTNGTRGEDVRLLHHELRLLGFRLIPDSETRPGIFGPHTLVAVREFQEKAGLKVTGIVDEATARAINGRVDGLPDVEPEKGPFLVSGRVSTAAGQPVADVIVRAFDRDLRSEELLGKTTTDAAGLYEVRYGPNALRRPEKGTADVVVKVSSADDRQPLATSPVLFNAPPEATVDVTIPAEVLPPPTLFEEIGKALEPALEGLTVAELEENEQHQDLTFLSGETGFGKSVLARFVIAHRLAHSYIPDLPAEFWFALLGGSFFQYVETQSLATQTETVLASLPPIDADTVRKALTRSVNEKEISPVSEEKLASWIEAFLPFAASRLVSETDRPTLVKSALDDAGIKDPGKQATFARLFTQHNGLTPELLTVLERDPSFTKEEVADLHTSFRLEDLTKADFSVIKMIKDEFGVHQPKDLPTLAKKSEREWVNVVQAKLAAGEIKIPFEVGSIIGQDTLPDAEIYGKTLDRQFREGFPTAAFSGGLERALGNGGARGLQRAPELIRFLDRHEDFEFLNTQVDDFLQNNLHPDFQDLAQDKDFGLQLKAAQRMVNIAQTFEAVDTLLADNLHSAQQIYRLGETEFVQRYAAHPGFTAESARLTWTRAADNYAAVLTLVADLNTFNAEYLPWVLQLGNEAEALSTFPNWNNLFRGGDLCECEHCRSVLGPAAYFTDLLMFLKDRKAANSATVKDVLFRRRPDLGFLELNCDNALTTLPYIDVVNEVLEDVIAEGENDLELAGFTSMPTDPTGARDAVADRLPLSGDWTLSQVNPSDPDRWVAHGDDATWLLKKKGAPNFFAEILRNTKASAAELRAYPQYVNPKAYEKLRAAKYPMTLPFDLFAEEVRAAVQKTNLQRWDLMRTFQNPEAPQSPTDGEVAAEYFGISADPTAPFDEKRLILDADADPSGAGQRTVWGVTPNANLLGEVGNVKRFLQKTHLEYEELLALLDLEFINPKPKRDIAVHHLDDSCDTAKKVIQVLDVTKLDRIHRFLRLWRKLEGWQMWELDLAIRNARLGNGVLNEAFLINFFHFSELRKRLGGKTTVEQALALFGYLNTETRFTKLHEKRTDGLYQQLFLNRRLIQPLDPAFEVAKVKGSTAETILGHRPVILAALGIREADLILFEGFTDGNLTLKDLSLLWRHAWLSKQLKLRAEDWKVVLKILPQAALDFLSPKAALEFLDKVDHLKASGFTPDELNWLLAADRSVKAATKEADAARFLLALRKELQAIRADNDPAQVPSEDVEQLTALLTSLLQKLNRDEPTTQLFLAALRDDDLFADSRLILKFFEPVFTAALANLPAEVDFKALPDPVLAQKISYDAEQRLLRFSGILSLDEKAALDVLSTDASYLAAVDSLFTQPETGTFSAERLWLQDADLLFPLPDHVAENFKVAARKALTYLSRTLSENAVVQQVSAQLDLPPAVARLLLTRYELLPETLLTHLTETFATTSGALDYATSPDTFNGWFWANRVATFWKRWKLTLADLEKIIALTAGAQLLDFLSLPLDSTKPMAPFEQFARTSRLLKFRQSLPETGITLLEVLEKLTGGAYPTANLAVFALAFAPDVEQLNGEWHEEDVKELVASLDIINPLDYLLVENWERLRRAFHFLGNLNAAASTAKTFAAAAMTEVHAKSLKELLRSKFGAETWLTLSTEIQDVLRERKRDALAAYLLTQPPKPPEEPAPTGKWENTNDLYAYYLLDVEMSSCQLTSRLVQASGSVQLFVQRCFMGLEPDVKVHADGADGDSAWRWWKWMRKYRVWEANRKVFLWPENWIEPELRKDKSPFFRDLENQLLQNEVNQENVEAAFTSYLEKLGDVAQLEVAGFYQEDDGDNTILHVFGRTTGAEPHLYYYRRYDYRQWTPWEEVKLDIQGDYLIPMVVNKQLFLFWPVFTEEPDEAGNRTVQTPSAGSPASLPETSKRLKLQMAVSRYQQGKWTPKKVSKDAVRALSAHKGEILKNRYRFWAIDRSEVDGRVGIQFDGRGDLVLPSISTTFFKTTEISTVDDIPAILSGVFELNGCKGAPELTFEPLGNFQHVIYPEVSSVGGLTAFLKWVELPNGGAEDGTFQLISNASVLTLPSAMYILRKTPGIFKMTPPWHLSVLDKLGLDGSLAKGTIPGSVLPLGIGLPFFYNDQKRTFFVLPSLGRRIDYYPDIKETLHRDDVFFAGLAQTKAESLDLSALPSSQRHELEQSLSLQFPEMPPPPYTDVQLRELRSREIMRPLRSYRYSRSNLLEFQSFHFKNFYHPFVCDFSRLVYNPLQGIPALMSRETQLKDSGFRFKQVYQPTAVVVDPLTEDLYPREVVDFSPDGAYSPYNWELFFHAPLLVANLLSKNQRFEEARDWYHFMFNPIGVESGLPSAAPMSRYWITKPFFETTDPQYVQQRIENILRLLSGDTSVQGSSATLKADLEAQVRDWRTNPFDPHRIASYRTGAYQKTVVMKYLDNLIAWGDFLFRQDSMESINEATQLYVLAAEILGPRPRKVPPRVKPPLESFNELENQLDKFSNALVQVENLIPPQSGNGQAGADPAPLPTLYFCIPHNDKMLGYWDTVADRLFKIRHCMNIEGVVRQLALFEPPIDPAALVKAVAAGLDISAALADLNAPLPLYRFNVLLQKANEVCNDVKALGGALLSALEKKDAEALALLRQGHEIRLLEAVQAVREQQIDEAKENLEGIKRSKVMVETRRDYYRDIERLIAQEKLHLDKMRESHNLQEVAQGIKLAASIVSLLPDINLGASGFGGTPLATFKIGGLGLGQAGGLAADVLSFLSQIAGNEAAVASSMASFDRRWEDWKLQERLADRELDQLDRQIAAAELRIAIAKKELENQVLQIENAKATDDFMRSKYTNEELYQWQVGQISGVYFQSYKLAYDLAKRAERCFRFELGLQDSSYITFGYWDSLKKGLLSGEKLQYDLRRLEAAHLEQNRRDFELTKNVSLALLDPLALVRLRETGRCFFSLPEEIFDLDYPGHYFRRIKSVSLTLPCVAGPYTTISCTLRLLKNSVRINTANGDNGYPHNTDDQGLPADDPRFAENNIPVKAIAASNAQNDSGMFELSFRDERYLPFEGAGAISNWSLELFNDSGNPDFGKPLRQIDYSTITDAILHVKYMAREDAGPFKTGAVTHLRKYFDEEGPTPALRMFDLRRELPTQWHRFLNPANGNVFELEMSPDLFPLRDQGKTLKVNQIWLLARCTDPGSYTVVMAPPLPPPPPPPPPPSTLPPPPDPNELTLARVALYGGLHFVQKDTSALTVEIKPDGPPVTWALKMSRAGGNLQEEEVKDLFLVLGYEWKTL